MRRSTDRRPQCGLTLIEVAVVLTVVGIVTAMAWPSHLGELQRARRLDATSALTRLQCT